MGCKEGRRCRWYALSSQPSSTDATAGQRSCRPILCSAKWHVKNKVQLTFRIHRPRSSRVAQRLRGRPLLRRALLQRHAIGKAADGRKTLMMLLMRRRPRTRPAITHDLCSRRKHGRKVRGERPVAASRCKVNSLGVGKIEKVRKCKVGCSSLDDWRKFAA